MQRRAFLKIAPLGTLLAAKSPLLFSQGKTHILTLSFDDGFRKSFLRIADICEEFRLLGCFNVIASGHLPEFKQVDNWIQPELMGDFTDWNNLVTRGHEVMPHSWKHLNLAKISHRKAVKLIDKCLEYFSEHLQGYKNEEAIFNFPFNASTPALENYLLTKVRAVRTWGAGAINSIPDNTDPLVLGCASRGPQNIDDWVDEKINAFLQKEKGWLILNLHGLDDEGWGTISDDYLHKLLARLIQIPHLEVLPTGMVLKRLF